MSLFNRFRPTIAIDPGTKSLRVSKDGKIIFDEATALAINTDRHQVSHIGNAALNVKGDHILHPVDYVIRDFQAFELLAKGVMKREERRILPTSYKIFLSVPIGSSDVDKRAYRDSAEHINGILVYMCNTPVMAALNMGILQKMKNFFLIDFSASKLEVAAFSNAMPIESQGLRMGTLKLEQLIQSHIHRKYGIKPTEEELRQLINSYPSPTETINIQFKEMDLSEVEEIIERYLWLAEDTLRNCLESLDHHTLTRVSEKGIYFTGGGSLYQNLCDSLAKRCGLKAHFSEQPFHDPILGLQQVSKEPDNFKAYLMA